MFNAVEKRWWLGEIGRPGLGEETREDAVGDTTELLLVAGEMVEGEGREEIVELGFKIVAEAFVGFETVSECFMVDYSKIPNSFSFDTKCSHNRHNSSHNINILILSFTMITSLNSFFDNFLAIFRRERTCKLIFFNPTIIIYWYFAICIDSSM